MPNPFCEELLGRPDAREALQWLREGRSRGFTLGELRTTKSSIQLVLNAYKAGAACVTAVEIDEYPDAGGAQNTGRLVITLPDEPNRRAEMLQWASRISERRGFDAHEDCGKRHIFLILD